MATPLVMSAQKSLINGSTEASTSPPESKCTSCSRRPSARAFPSDMPPRASSATSSSFRATSFSSTAEDTFVTSSCAARQRASMPSCDSSPARTRSRASGFAPTSSPANDQSPGDESPSPSDSSQRAWRPARMSCLASSLFSTESSSTTISDSMLATADSTAPRHFESAALSHSVAGSWVLAEGARSSFSKVLRSPCFKVALSVASTRAIKLSISRCAASAVSLSAAATSRVKLLSPISASTPVFKAFQSARTMRSELSSIKSPTSLALLSFTASESMRTPVRSSSTTSSTATFPSGGFSPTTTAKACNDCSATLRS
mmetsp:Transcript_24126/g.47093  ORF Transcript_24126/g.47093 Transcript_24126/m.47093 type:complete len:317 (+) Transcript_24126:1352-2302(+)